MPRASAGAASRPAWSLVGSSAWPSNSLMRARFTMHSRSTDSRDLAEVRIGFGARRRRAGRHDEAHERVVEAVLDAYQRRRDADQRVLLGRRAARDDVGQARQLALDLLAHGAEAQHRERVADLLEQVDLRGELLGRAALARVEVERVLDAAEVLLDRGSHRAHEPHRRRRQRFTLLLDRTRRAAAARRAGKKRAPRRCARRGWSRARRRTGGCSGARSAARPRRTPRPGRTGA